MMNSQRRIMYHFQRYRDTVSKAFKERPVVANSMLCIGLYTAGDISAQYVEQKYQTAEEREEYTKKNTKLVHYAQDNYAWDYERTGRISSYGAFITGPLLAVWYPFLERLTKSNNIARFGTLAVPLAKVFMDEFVLEPPFLLVFFGYMNIAEGGTIDSYKNKLSNEYIPTYITSLMGWPLVLLINFRYVPVFAQSAVVNACCVVWNGFLSYRNAKSSAVQHESTTTTTTAAATTVEEQITNKAAAAANAASKNIVEETKAAMSSTRSNFTATSPASKV